MLSAPSLWGSASDKTMTNRLSQLMALHYLFSPSQSGKVVAHCLDLDLVAVAETIETSEAQLNTLVRAQIELAYRTNNLDAVMFLAPFEYWKQLETATPLKNTHLEIEVPPLVLPVSQQLALPVLRSQAEPLAA